jgi:hypothetical protein
VDAVGVDVVQAVDVRLAGDDAPVALAERPAAKRMLASTDPLDAIRRSAKLIVDVALRVAPLWPALRQAAAVDSEIDDLLRTYGRARRDGIAEVVDLVANLGALRRGRSRARAKDAVFLLTDPSTIDHAEELGWSRADLERWYTDCLSALLLG